MRPSYCVDANAETAQKHHGILTVANILSPQGSIFRPASLLKLVLSLLRSQSHTTIIHSWTEENLISIWNFYEANFYRFLMYQAPVSEVGNGYFLDFCISRLFFALTDNTLNSAREISSDPSKTIVT